MDDEGYLTPGKLGDDGTFAVFGVADSAWKCVQGLVQGEWLISVTDEPAAVAEEPEESAVEEPVEEPQAEEPKAEGEPAAEEPKAAQQPEQPAAQQVSAQPSITKTGDTTVSSLPWAVAGGVVVLVGLTAVVVCLARRSGRDDSWGNDDEWGVRICGCGHRP